MTQRGKRSAASLAIIPRVDGRPRHLEPPSDLPEAERRIWAQLVGSCPPQHFQRSDEPLMVAYVEAIAQLTRAGRALREQGDVLPDGSLNRWGTVQERAIKTLATFSLRLRLVRRPGERRPKRQSTR